MREIKMYLLNLLGVRALCLLHRVLGLEFEVINGRIVGYVKSPAMEVTGEEQSVK